MLKVFLVEDEVIVRDGIRRSIPWEQCGYTYVGDASDGETALPMIRRSRPDVLITDIKMPFMDGLELAGLVRKELPMTKIIIISGYDDFAYAQQAISMGVEKYLLKPVTKSDMTGVLTELAHKLEDEGRQRDYMERLRLEQREYEQYSRRSFFEQLVMGSLTALEIYETADKLKINLDAQCYNIVMLTLHTDSSGESYNDSCASVQESVMRFLQCSPEYILFRWNLNTYAVLIKGADETIQAMTADCVESISRRCREATELAWYIAAGTPVQRLSALPDCFSEVNKNLSCCYIFPDIHILTREHLDSSRRQAAQAGISDSIIEPALVKSFLAEGTVEEIPEFVTGLLGRVSEAALSSALFCRYLCMTVRIAAQEYIESLGLDTKDFLRNELSLVINTDKPENARQFVRLVLRRTIEQRRQSMRSRYRDLIEQAAVYIDEHYAESGISLNSVAKTVNLSPNYFSALFSQETGSTFVEYLTAIRMKQACRLLRETAMRSSEIAAEVGYNDPHYFSFIFKKTQGCTPRDYRGGSQQ